MAREQLTDLDLNGNSVLDIADGSSAQDATAYGQLTALQTSLEASIEDLTILHWMGE